MSFDQEEEKNPMDVEGALPELQRERVGAVTNEEREALLEEQLQETDERLDHLKASVLSEQEREASLREQMGLSPSNDTSPSIVADLAAIAAEIGLELIEKWDIVKLNHAETKVQEAKEQNKHVLMDLIFEACHNMPEKDLEHLIEFGLKTSGETISLPIIGDVTPNVAKIFAKAVKEGKHSFPMELLEKSGELDKIEEKLEHNALGIVIKEIMAHTPDATHKMLGEVVVGVAQVLAKTEKE